MEVTTSLNRLDTRRVLVRNTAWNYVGFGANLLTNLVVFPYVVHGLGDAAAGIWLLLSSVTGYMGLLELGIVPSLTQIVASTLATDDRRAVSRAASTSLVLLVTLSTVPFALAVFVPKLIALLGIPPALEGQSITAFRLTIVGFALRMPLATLQALLLGTQRQDRCNQLWILIGLAKCLAAFLVIVTGHGLVELVAAEVTVHLLAAGLQYWWVSQELPDLSLSWRLADTAVARDLITFGGALLIMGLGSLIVEQTDRFVIAAFLPVAEVTYYGAGWKIYMLAYAVTTTLAQALAPLAASLHGHGDREALAALFLRMTKYTAALAWPLVFTLACCAEVLLKIWLGAPYIRAANVVVVLAVSFAVTAYNHAGYQILVGTRRVNQMVWVYQTPQAVFNLALSLFLVTRMGIVGVALGTMVPAILLEYPFLRFLLRELNLTWREFGTQVLAGTALPAVVSFSPLLIAYWTVDRQSMLLPILAAFGSLLYFACFWGWSLTAGERSVIQEQAKVLQRRIMARSDPDFKTPTSLPGS